MTTVQSLGRDEYDSYFYKYLSLNEPNKNIFETLEYSLQQTLNFLDDLKTDLDYRYLPDKWSVAEVLMHNIDTERIFQYRALRFLRGDKSELAGFDQDVFVENLKEHAFAKADIKKSFSITRASTIDIFKGASEDRLKNKGKASGKVMSARVIPFLIAGHNKHHENIIKERY
ncbi:MAG: DinB family protein [Nonlabens sp.]